MQISGDYDNIVEYFSRLLVLQRRRMFPVHDYTFEFNSMKIIEDADSGSVSVSSDFPEKDTVDRVMSLNFSVRKGRELFNIDISRENFEFSNIENSDFDYGEFVSLIDDSTFRFF